MVLAARLMAIASMCSDNDVAKVQIEKMGFSNEVNFPECIRISV